MSDYATLREELNTAYNYIRQLGGEVPPPPTATVPVNVDIPFVEDDGAGTLTCTMGNWTGEPSAYAYQWAREDIGWIGDGTSSYTVDTADVGHVVNCVVTATNAAGSTAAPPSNAVTVTEPPPVTRSAARENTHARTRR